MTSILTNPSAMTALQTLTATMQSLKSTQAHISTGLRITSAADNASYWSIATSMKSDSGVLATVSDALNMGASTLDVASTGLTNAITLLNKIKTSLAAAGQPGADRVKIQEDIQQQQNALRSTANSASFNGQNWMQIDSGQDNFNYTRSVIASYSRDASGNVNVGYIQANISTVALIDKNVGNDVTAYDAENFPTVAIRYTGTVSATNGNGTAGDEVTGTLGWDADNNEYTVTDGGTAYTIGAEDITDLEFDGRTATLTHTEASTDPVTNEETPAKFKITYKAGGLLDTVDDSTTGTYTDSNGALTTSDVNGTGVSMMTMDISNLTDSAADMATLNSFSQQVDNVIAKITAAATNVGAVTSRLGLQQTFVASLQDSIDKGVGSLVDADMNLESTKLQALQVQQQLGIQSLSIANSSAQSILKLFG